MKKEFKIGDRVEVTAICDGYYKIIKENGIILGFDEMDAVVKIDSGNGYYSDDYVINHKSDKDDLITIQTSLGHTIKHI